MNLEGTFREAIREIVKEEIAHSQPKINLVPAEKFLSDTGLSRTSLWRKGKDGSVKFTHIGRRIFIDLNQFAK